MLEKLKELIEGKSVCILGFGREGQSTYHTIRRISEDVVITIADKDASLLFSLPFLNSDCNINFHGGKDYLSILSKYDIIFKTPGITLKQLDNPEVIDKITSQSEVFIDYYKERIIGITGTKGKSTTASLIYNILSHAGRKTILVGNIGLPPFESLDDIENDTEIIYELSSHQLETLEVSPHIAIILNLFEEHLDHYNSYDDYKNAKLNIAKYQKPDDVLIYNMDNEELCDSLYGFDYSGVKYAVCIKDRANCNACTDKNKLILRLRDQEIGFSIIDSVNIKGEHNLVNCLMSAMVCKIKGVKDQDVIKGLISFEGLRHRIELVGKFGGISFYNDSIATIPQATMEAIKTIGNVEFLILGGFDRGVDYNYLAGFLGDIHIKNILCIGNAGKRIFGLLQETNCMSKVQIFDTYEDIFKYIKSIAEDGDTCLLSPAAASYDMFKDFEERGDKFTELAKSLRG